MSRIAEKRMKRLIEAWDDHIELGTDIQSCKYPSIKFLIHGFFMEMKSKLDLNGSKKNE